MLPYLALLTLLLVLGVPCGLIDVASEDLFPLSHLARRLPRRRQGRPVAPSTVHRWRCPGIRGVRLECLRVGGCWHTSMPAFMEFCRRLSALDDHPDPASPEDQPGHGTDRDQQRRQDEIERRLDRELGG